MRFTNSALKKKFLSTCENLSDGQLTLSTPEGETYHFGTRGAQAEMHIRDWSTVSALSAFGDVGLGQTYAQGLWDTPSVEGVMGSLMRNRALSGARKGDGPLKHVMSRVFDGAMRANTRSQSRKDLRAHRNVGNEFFQLWLDEGMTYSSALFEGAQDDLSRGHTRKNARALSKLANDGRILEIGIGSGSFAEHAVTEGRDVTGVTMSRDQHAYAESRLDGRADLRLGDVHAIEGLFDSIVAIEAGDAFGQRNWPALLKTLKKKLGDDGRILLQAITVPNDFLATSKTSAQYIRQSVFPDGALLSDQVIAAQAQDAGLKVIDSFGFGQDYAKTYRIWAQRLKAQKLAIADMGYDERFFRNWQYRLEIGAASFAVDQTNVVQVQLTHV